MRSKLMLVVGLLLVVGVCPVPAANESKPFDIKIVSKAKRETVPIGGRNVTMVYVSFAAEQRATELDPSKEYWVYVYEEKDPKKGVEQEALVKKIKLSSEKKESRPLSVVLAVDTSGSMVELTKNDSTRMKQAQEATGVFFTKLPPPPKAEAGLVLFNHEIYKTLPLKSEQKDLTLAINQATAKGGTAYLDACLAAVSMLKEAKDRDKALVLLTDGQDLNSTVRDLKVVVKAAQDAGVKIYPVGIGEPGQPVPVTSVLTLDISGSMIFKANSSDASTKLKALINAANKFVEVMPESTHAAVRSSVLLFSDSVKFPSQFGGSDNFTKNKDDLRAIIKKLLPPEERTALQKAGKSDKDIVKDRIQAEGETALFDATYAAIGMLQADGGPGKKVVVTLTDGVDNSSIHRVEEVIDSAKKANIQLYMLGLGQEGEIDETVMKRMASETGGQYFKAGNEKDLIDIFETLSVNIHDEGINVEELTQLARETGGKYYHAKNVDQLTFIIEEINTSILTDQINVEFESRFQGDLLDRKIDLDLIETSLGAKEVKLIDTKKEETRGQGLILAQMSPTIYVGMLGGLVALLVIPAGLKRMTKKEAAK